ncbi:MAG TPA: mechanosensitive ion channel domain-containing protein [Chitinophagaceae bacterium]|nr:mechanosensitive ion channel domain-containing protein [Chitinophagaceae bacterium]
MNLLNKIFFGNPVQDWLIAFGIVVVAFSIIKIFKGPLLKEMKKWSAKTTNTFDDFLVMAIEKDVIPFLYFVTLFAAIQYLTFSTRAEHIIQVAMLFITTFFILRLISSAIQYSVFAFLSRQENSETKQKQARGLLIILKITIWILGLVFLIDNLGYNVTTIITGLGIGGIAIALAAQAILGDLFSYFVIFFDRPFEIGDFIIVDDNTIGAIEYIGVKTTRIRAISGEQIICGNKNLTDSRVHNYKRMMRRRVVFSLGVTYQTSPEQIRKIPQVIGDIISAKENTTFDRSHFSGFGDFSLNFETVYFIEGADYNIFMDIQQSIYLEILEKFNNEKIEFAYPTQTLFAANSFLQQQLTGKSQTNVFPGNENK